MFYSKVEIHHPKGTTIFSNGGNDFQGIQQVVGGFNQPIHVRKICASQIGDFFPKFLGEKMLNIIESTPAT